jgi:hypothetical protein
MDASDPATAGLARVGRWLLVVAIAGSALGLGALHTPVLVGVGVVVAIATVLLWYDAEPLDPRPAATTLVLVCAGLVVWSVVQIVPLPRGLLAVIAPENADIWARCLTPLRQEGPRFASISLDPTATRVQILRGVVYLMAFAGALRVARRQEGVVFLERALVASSVVIAAAALMHPVLGAQKVFGLYEPGEKLGFDPHHLGPLLNLNHLAAYLNVGLFVAVQCVMERRDAIPRPLALVVTLLLGATVVWTGSRGGFGASVLGTFLAAMIVWAGRRSRRSQLLAPFAALVALVGSAVTLSLTIFDDSRAKFMHGDLFAKIDLVRTSFGLLRDHGLVGIGRGAFESTFPKLWTFPEYYVNTHPENLVAQWTTEWGVPVAACGFVAIGWALRPRTALARSRAPAGAWAALVAVAAHNMVDFSSELPGVVIALAVCAAIVTGGAGARTSSSRTPPDANAGLAQAWWRRPRAFVMGACAALACALAGTLPFTSDELYNEQRAFRDVGLDRSMTRDAFHEQAKLAMLRHPAEPYLPFVGAVRAIVARDESVLPWAARALERRPVYGRVHLLIARSLFVRNRSQARLEYRLACAQDSIECGLEESLPLVGEYDDAMELVPDGPRGPIVLAVLTDALGKRLPSTVVRLDRELLARDPMALGPVHRDAAFALQDVKNGEAWCTPVGPTPEDRHDVLLHCAADGLAAAARLRATKPDQCDGYALDAELRVAIGEVEAGYGALDGALDHVADRSACAQRLVSLALETHNGARVDAAIDRLLKLGCDLPSECVENLTFAASVEASRGRSLRGLTLLKKAWERAPERDDLLAEVATKAEAQGFHGEALDAYGKLSERHPEEERWTAGLARERDAVARGIFRARSSATP